MSARSRPTLTSVDRLLWILMYCLWPRSLDALVIVKPETVIDWHRMGLRRYWRWKSRRRRPGRPAVAKDIRQLSRRMSQENPLWGAPRIHGELLKLGIKISQTTICKHMLRQRTPPSQTWRVFLANHVGKLAAIDLFAVPTATFQILYVILVLRHERRMLVHFDITANPTSIWLARQITEAFPWETASRHLIRDRNASYGQAYRARL